MAFVRAVRLIEFLHFLHHAVGFRFNPAVMQRGDMLLEVPRPVLLAAVLLLPQQGFQCFQVVGLCFKAFKLPKLRVWVPVKILSGGL